VVGYPSYDGRYVYFVASTGFWRVEVDSQKQECLGEFAMQAAQGDGVVGPSMSTTALSGDGLWWAIVIDVGGACRLVILNTQTGDQQVILERHTIGHPQFHPDNPALLRYAGRHDERIRVIGRDGRGDRLVYQRDEAAKPWVVHEIWMPGDAVGGRHEIATCVWPHGMIGIDVDSGKTRRICSFNAWHPMVNRSGDRMVADTVFPDRGLMLFDPTDSQGEPALLCESDSDNCGDHWDTDHCPYDDGPIQVYAPQHTHPHPSFSPDGTTVVFTSGRPVVSRVCEVLIPLV